MTSSFKDLFSKQAGDYSRFRPSYPPELFSHLASLVPDRTCAWDCGTGNGQAALELARFFDRVIATDPSEKQLSQARPDPRIEYRLATAERSELPPHSVSLITVAQAFHWFRHDEFFEEVRRVLKPGGILALWCYELAEISPDLDAAILHFYREDIGQYWEPERRWVESGYRDLRVPFTELEPPKLQMRENWDFSRLAGYLATWSSVQTAIRRTGRDPLETFVPGLSAIWGDPHRSREIRWPLSLRVFRI